MAPKSILEKEAWQWAETILPNNITDEHKRRAYRLAVKACQQHSCRRNCVGSPFCLNMLGEKWAFEQKESKEKAKLDVKKGDEKQKDGKSDVKNEDSNTEEAIKDVVSDNGSVNNNGESDDSSDDDSDSEDEEIYCQELDNKVRKEGQIIGLKNLGATCYINTLLQVWFHNPIFRRAILLWKDVLDSDDDDDDDDDDNGDEMDDGISMEVDESGGGGGGQTSRKRRRKEMVEVDSNAVDVAREVCRELQIVFAELKFCNRRYVNPSQLIGCLRLDESMQQDAQEFSKLLLSVLESVVPPLRLNAGKNLIQELFVGEYEYITRCNKCEIQSHRSSSFYELELNIKGNDSLDDCVNEFLDVERLEGDNQYMCRVCGMKSDATRRIQLRTLPPVLNLQLMRFVFDRKTMSKKKLNTYVQFPLELDMSGYMVPGTSGVGGLMYDLYAVLVHSGSSANSGHYITLVRDVQANTAYVMNDVDVNKMANTKLRMEDVENVDKSAGKKPRLIDGHLMSCNAYMLVYIQRQHGQQPVPDVKFEEIHEAIRETIERENTVHEGHVIEQLTIKKSLCEIRKLRRKDIKQVYDAVINQKYDVENCEWVSAKWFSRWVSVEAVEEHVLEVDNTPLLCEHERMDPNKIESAKLLPPDAIEMINRKYGINVRLPCKESMCLDCVMVRCHEINSRHLLGEHLNMFKELCKLSPTSAADGGLSWYWLGKNTLKNWKKLAEEKLFLTGNNADDDAESTNGSAAGDGESGGGASGGGDVDMDGGEDGARARSQGFNGDIICEHNELTPNLACRRLVPPAAWNILKKYFPNAQDLTSHHPVCDICLIDDRNAMEQREKEKDLAQQQKQELMSLYSQRCRPSIGDPTHDTLYVVTEAFVNSWSAFVRDPKKNAQPTELGNRSCICCHDGLVYDVSPNAFLSGKLQFLTPEEWDILKKYVEPDYEIIVSRYVENGQIRYTSVPDKCEECCSERVISEMRDEFDYTNGTVYVRKYSDLEAFTQTISRFRSSTSTSSSSENHLDASVTTSSQASSADKAKNDSGCDTTTSIGAKRKIKAGGTAAAAAVNGCSDVKQPRVENQPSVQQAQQPRRSARKHDARSFIVSSNLTIKQFKLQLCTAFGVMKSDQYLHHHGLELTNDSMTFAQYCIPRDALIHMFVDQSRDTETTIPDAVVEEGFRGSVLMGQ